MNGHGEHGFRTRREWEAFFEEYQKIGASVSQDNIPVPQNSVPMELWLKEYQRRSQNIRNVYSQVEEILDWHIRYFTRYPGRWEEETADSLLSFLFRKCIQIDDSETCMGVADSLIPFYEERQNEKALMKCYMIKMVGYAALDTVNWTKEILACGRKAAALYEKNYDCLNEEERSMGISIYDFQADQLSEMTDREDGSGETLETEYLPMYYRSMEMVDRVIASVDLTEKLHSSLPDIRMLFQSRLASMAVRQPADYFTEEQMKFLHETAKTVYEMVMAGQTSEIGSVAVNEITYLMTERLVGNVTAETIQRRIMELESLFPDPKGAGERQCDSILLEADQVIILSMSRLAENNPSMRDDLKKVLKLAIRRVIALPHRTFSEYVLCNDVYRSICPNLRYLEDRAEIVQSLLGITVFRQMQTAFHTLMVGKLASLITGYVVDERPELLVGQLETRSEEEVKAKKEKIVYFAYMSALLHDVGKLFCSAVINMQYRKITDIEFQTIKFHPGTGGKILSMIPQLEEFHDIAAGHHRSFDGKTGYPMEFDNTKSPKKIFIDLITICDSLDAATDTMGRNYARAKTFEQVLGELQERAGSSYSDVLVDLISSSEKLKAELAELIEKERGQVYYDVYLMLEKMSEEMQAAPEGSLT